MLRFEARDLKPWAEFVHSDELEIGTIYFSLSFLDDEMLVPELKPLVFIGSNLNQECEGAYFQDVPSYQAGVRYDSWKREDEALFQVFPISDGSVWGVSKYENALDQLLVCALKRKKVVN